MFATRAGQLAPQSTELDTVVASQARILSKAPLAALLNIVEHLITLQCVQCNYLTVCHSVLACAMFHLLLLVAQMLEG